MWSLSYSSSYSRNCPYKTRKLPFIQHDVQTELFNTKCKQKDGLAEFEYNNVQMVTQIVKVSRITL